jgi:hypothetical protein
MAEIKINDLPTGIVSGTMQLETDIAGTTSNKITISSLATYLSSVLPISGLTWSVVNMNQNIVIQNGYIANSGSLITFTLPTTANAGDTFRILGRGSGGWRVNQNAGQTINLGGQPTTTGASGYCASTHARDCIEVVCVTTDTDFEIVSSIGNINLV